MSIEQALPRTERRFRLRSGEVAAELSGNLEAPLLIGIPGLSANLRSFDAIFPSLDPARHHMLAYDPRGRAKSPATGAGTYGWPAHVADILEMADQLGAETFDLIGWSMGTWIAMKTIELAPARVRRLVLIDGGGIPDESATVPIYAGMERLGTVYPSYEAFAQLAQAIGVYEPWEPWEALFRYEFEEVPDGVRARTQKEGPWEDEAYRKAHDPYTLWRSVKVPTLVVRAGREIMPGMGYIWNQADQERFLREVPTATACEVDANHYTVGMHPDTAAAISEFLDAG